MNFEAKDYFEGKEIKNESTYNIGMILMILGIIGTVIFGIWTIAIYNDKDPSYFPLICLFISIPAGIVGLIIAACSKTRKYPSGSEYDLVVKELIKKQGTNARECVGLDSSEVDEIDPVSFEGYKFIGAGKTKKDSQDSLWRSDLYEKVTIFFTNSEIHIYKAFLNTITSKVTETTDVLFYDDVVSVSTKNEIEKIGNDSIEYISFNLITKGGNNMSVALNGNEDIQRSVNAMRAMIKEKKTQ